jgi:hypothetical protein
MPFHTDIKNCPRTRNQFGAAPDISRRIPVYLPNAGLRTRHSVSGLAVHLGRRGSPIFDRTWKLLESQMTTSKETEWMNHPRLRKLVTAVNELTLAERITLVKGLVPAIADELSDTEYEKFVAAIRLKGERFHEAQAHPGEGRAERKIPGERDIEGR